MSGSQGLACLRASEDRSWAPPSGGHSLAHACSAVGGIEHTHTPTVTEICCGRFWSTLLVHLEPAQN